jgi:hypothetical protein
MMRGPLSFKETDVMSAIKCATKAGLQVVGFEITKAGHIVVHAGKLTARQYLCRHPRDCRP